MGILAGDVDDRVRNLDAVGIDCACDLAFELLIGAVHEQRCVGIVDDRVALAAVEELVREQQEKER